MMKLLENICMLAKETGHLIMHFYSHPELITINYKSDKTPVTNIDIEASNMIQQKLMFLTPNIPVISEENLYDLKIYQNCHNYWLIDPLDGTKEFLNRNGNFTVNISLIENYTPIMGVIYAPFLKKLYFSLHQQAWKEEKCVKRKINVCNIQPPLVVASYSHYDENIDSFLQNIGDYRLHKMGSSLKFCLVAEGKAQIYPRFGNTYIWDTAAGHAILIASGGILKTWKGAKLTYRLSSNLINPGFYAAHYKLSNDFENLTI